MNVIKNLTLAAIPLALLFAQNSVSATLQELEQDMQQGCPIAWEDLGISINSALPGTGLSVWNGDTADRGAFITVYALNNPSLSSTELETAADDLATVAEQCASFRIALLDELLQKTPVDVNAALTQAGPSNLLSSAWMTGDVRVTGRANAAAGWVFLNGQTIGETGSAADLAGDQYFNLFELAKNWAGNNPSADFYAGGLAALPDMRGRSLTGTDNMGGQSANVITDAAADGVGGEVGAETVALSEAQMPSHTHNMQQGGIHNHTMQSKGAHQHTLRSSIYTGSGAPHSDYHYFEGKARPNYQNNIQKNVMPSLGNHTHAIYNSTSHDHVNDATGSGQAHNNLSPSVVFNVEMKY